MKKYFKNTKDMSLDEKISWVIGKVPHILLNDMNIDISDVDDVLNNNGDTICILENEYCGAYAAKKAIESAINLLNTDIALLKSTDGILIILTVAPNYIFDGNNLFDEINTHISSESTIILAASTDYTFSENYVKATMVFVELKAKSKSKKV